MKTKKNTKTGLLLGVIFGNLLGLIVSGSIFMVSGNNLVFTLETLVVFTVIFGGYGSYVGVLLDLGTREQMTTQPTQARRAARTRTKTKPIILLGCRQKPYA